MSCINNTKQITIHNFSHKQSKANKNVSNNTTNTLNHQGQSFGYLEWVPQSWVDYHKQHSHHCLQPHGLHSPLDNYQNLLIFGGSFT